MKRATRTVTIRDVARRSGVSVTTVSRVLNNRLDVAEETTKKVQAVVHDLGYGSSLAARGLRSRRTNVIGLIIPEVASHYCQEILRGVNRTIALLDKNLIIYTSGVLQRENIALHERSSVGLLNGGIADGVIVVTPTATQFATDAPLVIIDPNNDNPSYPAIIATNREGALSAVDYLISLGHRRIAHISGRRELISSVQRLQGYREALEAAGIPVDEELIEIGDFSTATAIPCVRNLLALTDRPTAIFASNDMTAIAVYEVAAEMGLRIPQDLSVVGFDNLRESAFLFPPLTTVDQSVEKMGAMAMEILVKLVKGEPLTPEADDAPYLVKVPTQLVVRGSCAPVSPRSPTRTHNADSAVSR
ncbi:MAG TPA: LacI family DNA-binding transcriptional regulator [Anaerolineales bacterium]|nr:LacI family DNA-binding transcriptional regulator [Anaerolineales bacterium]HRF47389.1 LacI family DNA-binding transcriptional regulator [Anaerolineales bacterium]